MEEMDVLKINDDDDVIFRCFYSTLSRHYPAKYKLIYLLIYFLYHYFFAI